MRPLGEVQLSCLRTLANVRDPLGSSSPGTWYIGCGWLWDTYSETTRIMESLAKRGLVEKEVIPNPRFPQLPTIKYHINDAGREAAKQEK